MDVGSAILDLANENNKLGMEEQQHGWGLGPPWLDKQSQDNNSLVSPRGKSIAVVIKPELPTVGPPDVCKWVPGV